MDNKEDDYYKQIEEIDKSLVRYSDLEFFVFLIMLGSIIYGLYNYFITNSEVNFNAGIIVCLFCFVPLLILEVAKSRLYDFKRPLLANHKNILPVLNKYCCVEDFRAEESVSTVLLREFFGKFIAIDGEGNYLKCTFDNIPVETSGILLRIPHAHTGVLYAFFDGQIAVLKTQESFPRRLLITRTKTNDKTKDGFSLKDIHGFEYNHIIYDMLMPDKKVFWLDTLNERLKNSAVSVSKNFDQKWRVYSTNTKAAELLLRDCGKIRNYLLNTPRIAFILYDNNRIVFGGKYDFSLTDSASAEVSAESKAAIKAFFTKAIPLVTMITPGFNSLE